MLRSEPGSGGDYNSKVKLWTPLPPPLPPLLRFLSRLQQRMTLYRTWHMLRITLYLLRPQPEMTLYLQRPPPRPPAAATAAPGGRTAW